MRLGIYGGSFDPVHNGHLALARACQSQAVLDEVWFMPTAVQPLKQKGPHANDRDRIDMLNLAIETVEDQSNQSAEGEQSWRVCTLEIDRGGASYTVDTLRQLREELPDDELFFLIGADAVRDVPRWREPAEIFRLATLLVVRRAGEAESDLSEVQRLAPHGNQPRFIEMPLVDASSSEIRRRLVAGEPIDELVPRTVAEYIRQQRLYRLPKS